MPVLTKLSAFHSLALVEGIQNAPRSLIESTNRFGSQCPAKRKILFLPQGSSDVKSDSSLRLPIPSSSDVPVARLLVSSVFSK